MTNAPESRKTHVTRIVGTNRDGDRLDDIWVDLERMDIIKGKTGSQGWQRKLRWCDNPDADDYSPTGTPSRVMEIVKVCDPESDDVNDPQEWVPVPVIKSMRSRGGGGLEAMGQGSMDRFANTVDNDEQNIARISVTRKISNCDTNIDDAAQAAFDADPGRREYVVDGEFYEKDIASKDESVYVEHEIVTFFKPKGNSLEVMGQAGQSKLRNQYLIDESDAPENKVTGAFGINPPYRLDPYQNIINSNLSGLAVEFEPVSFIEIAPVVPATKKAVISFWFRVPKETMNMATAEVGADSSNPPPLTGIVPLMVWGDATIIDGVEFQFLGPTGEHTFTDYRWSDGAGEAGGCAGAGWVVINSGNLSFGKNGPVATGETTRGDPSYIGVDCTGDYPALGINIVMPKASRATMVGGTNIGEVSVSGDTGSYFDGGVCDGAPGYHVSPCSGLEMDLTAGPNGDTYSITGSWGEDKTDLFYGARPETFRTMPLGGSGNIDFKGARITADHWHHLLVSFDLSGSVQSKGVLNEFDAVWDDGLCDYVGGPDGSGATAETLASRTSGTAKLYVALDDVNLTGEDLSAFFPKGFGAQNGILSVNGYQIGLITGFNGSTVGPLDGGRLATVAVTGAPLPQYSYSPAGVPFNEGALGLPAPGTYADRIKEVEMAELQIALDVSVDTGKVVNRRAFITEDGTPASMKLARDLLGKKPEVIVHRTPNWKKARNTGGLAAPAAKIDGTASGTIDSYRPNPSLHGKQG